VVFLLNNLSRYAPPPLTEGYTPPPPGLAELNLPPSPQQHQYSQSNEREPYYILKTNNSFLFWVPDEYDRDHFMSWIHSFTSVIDGPIGSGKLSDGSFTISNT
jgi:hypothetical protein